MGIYSNWTGTWESIYSNTSYQNDTWLNVTLTALSNGNYVWLIWCNDSLGLENLTQNRSLIIDVPSRSGGGGGGTLIQNQTNATNQTQENQSQEQLNETIDLGNVTEGEKKAELKNNQTAYFRYEDEIHTIEVEDINDNQIRLLIKSNLIQVTINKGETKKIDLNSDGKEDIKITFNGIVNEKADLDIGPIVESITCENNYKLENGKCVRIETPKPKGINSIWFFTIAFIFVMGMVIVYLIVSANAKKKREG